MLFLPQGHHQRLRCLKCMRKTMHIMLCNLQCTFLGQTPRAFAICKSISCMQYNCICGSWQLPKGANSDQGPSS